MCTSPFVSQRKQLLHLSVPSLFIAVALDEGPGPPLRSPYADLSKLYAVVGILVRSCDVSVMQKSLYEVRILTQTNTLTARWHIYRARSHFLTHLLILSFHTRCPMTCTTGCMRESSMSSKHYNMARS